MNGFVIAIIISIIVIITLTILGTRLDNKIIEFKAWVKDKMSESNNSFISEAGDVEKWDGKINKDLVDKNIKEVVEYLEGLKT